MEKKFKIKCRGIIFYEGKLLLVKHPGDKVNYALPGGKLEYGEKILDALKREMHEEFGIEVEIGRLLYINNYIEEDGVNYIEFFFEIKNTKDFIDINSLNGEHKDELSEIIWKDQKSEFSILPKQIEVDFKNGKLLEQEVKFIA
jgi:ADP-ribose pyrophosphatase YjhB (NUDIX family)